MDPGFTLPAGPDMDPGMTLPSGPDIDPGFTIGRGDLPQAPSQQIIMQGGGAGPPRAPGPRKKRANATPPNEGGKKTPKP